MCIFLILCIKLLTNRIKLIPAYSIRRHQHQHNKYKSSKAPEPERSLQEFGGSGRLFYGGYTTAGSSSTLPTRSASVKPAFKRTTKLSQWHSSAQMSRDARFVRQQLTDDPSWNKYARKVSMFFVWFCIFLFSNQTAFF